MSERIKACFDAPEPSDDLRRRVRTLPARQKGPKTPMQVKVLTGIATAVVLGGFWINRPRVAQPTQLVIEDHVKTIRTEPMGVQQDRGVQRSSPAMMSASPLSEMRIQMLDHLDLMHPQIVFKLKERTVNIYDICRNPKGQILMLVGTGKTDADIDNFRDWQVSLGSDNPLRTSTTNLPHGGKSPLNGEILEAVAITVRSGKPQSFQLTVAAKPLQTTSRQAALIGIPSSEAKRLNLPLGNERRISTTIPSDWSQASIDVRAAASLIGGS